MLELKSRGRERLSRASDNERERNVSRLEKHVKADGAVLGNGESDYRRKYLWERVLEGRRDWQNALDEVSS